MSEKLSGDNGVLFSCESGEVTLLFRFRGLGFAGPRTAVRVLFTKFPTVSLADADEPRNMSPKDMETTETIRTVRVWVLEIALDMGDAPRG
jgi:hypothetical protein